MVARPASTTTDLALSNPFQYLVSFLQKFPCKSYQLLRVFKQ
jgi:hypothetical protein